MRTKPLLVSTFLVASLLSGPILANNNQRSRWKRVASTAAKQVAKQASRDSRNPLLRAAKRNPLARPHAIDAEFNAYMTATTNRLIARELAPLPEISWSELSRLTGNGDEATLLSNLENGSLPRQFRLYTEFDGVKRVADISLPKNFVRRKRAGQDVIDVTNLPGVTNTAHQLAALSNMEYFANSRGMVAIHPEGSLLDVSKVVAPDVDIAQFADTRAQKMLVKNLRKGPQLGWGVGPEPLQDDATHLVQQSRFIRQQLGIKTGLLTGLSMGAMMTWTMAEKAPQNWISFHPVAGKNPFVEAQSHLGESTPGIFAIHGEGDDILPEDGSGLGRIDSSQSPFDSAAFAAHKKQGPGNTVVEKVVEVRGIYRERQWFVGNRKVGSHQTVVARGASAAFRGLGITPINLGFDSHMYPGGEHTANRIVKQGLEEYERIFGKKY